MFLIFINDIDLDMHPDTLVSLFADDTAVWVQGRGDKQDSKIQMQQEIDKIQAWATKWKMKVNEGKTKTVIISTKSSDYKWNPELTLNGQEIESVKNHKFLGIKVDNGLRFTEQVDDTIRKCNKRVNILKCLAGKDWGQSLESQRTVLQLYVRTGLEYGSSSWWPWISDTNKERLERVQNGGLRAVAGLRQGCPVDFLRLETGIEPLHLRMQKNDAILCDKYRRLPDEDNRKQLLTKDAPTRLTTRKGWRDWTSSNESPVPSDFTSDLEHQKIQTYPIKPWAEFANVKVEKVELERKKEEYTNEQLKTHSLAKIAEYDVDFQIYTDGSTSGEQRNGGAGTYIIDSDGNETARFEEPFGSVVLILWRQMCGNATGSYMDRGEIKEHHRCPEISHSDRQSVAN